MSNQSLIARFSLAAALAIGLAGGINLCFREMGRPVNPSSLKDRIRADLLDADINKPWNAELHSALYKAFETVDNLSPEENIAMRASQNIMLQEMKQQMK